MADSDIFKTIMYGIVTTIKKEKNELNLKILSLSSGIKYDVPVTKIAMGELEKIHKHCLVSFTLGSNGIPTNIKKKNAI